MGSICMYCGEEAITQVEHADCILALEKMKEDLRNTPDGEKYKIFLLARNNYYGAPKKKASATFIKDLKKL